MSYSIDFDEAHEIVQVIYDGDVTLDERKQAVEKVCDTYRDIYPLKILVDVIELQMNLPVNKQQEFGEYLANHESLKNARVAVLHQPGINPNLMVDIAAYNSGYKLAQFSSIREAKMWLCEY